MMYNTSKEFCLCIFKLTIAVFHIIPDMGFNPLDSVFFKANKACFQKIHQLSYNIWGHQYKSTGGWEGFF